MRVLIVDPAGAGLDYAYRAQACGHKVKLFIRQTEKTRHIGRGMVEIVDEFQPWLRWAELIVNTDNTKYLRDLDMMRALGWPVISASQETADWELDRQKGQDILKKHGVVVPDCKEFSDYDQAIAYVMQENRRFVSKPSGDADKALSYVAKTPADMVYMLERWKRISKRKAPFILQEFIAGVEMAVGGWFGPHGFNAGWCENFEFKKLMDGDMGVATGEQGTVLRYVARSKLAKMMLEPLAEALEKLDYCGYIDVNCIIDDKGQPWPLEFTMRFGWPTFNIQQELHTGDCVEWLWKLSQGEDARNTLMNKVSLGVVMSVPDYPYSHLTRKEVVGSPIYGLTPGLQEHVHFCEVMQGKAPVDRSGAIVEESIPVTAGDYVLVMSATGETVYDAKTRAYARLKRLTLPNSPMYRTDIGDRLSKQLPIVQQQGFATGLAFSTSQQP
jgi:phosphoribosylamine--glycine ligase